MSNCGLNRAIRRRSERVFQFIRTAYTSPCRSASCIDIVSQGANHAKGSAQQMRDMKIANEDRTTTPFMTKYERARLIGVRATQIR